ncbi:MAG: hypothetical protein AB7S75_08345 [Desulfococcaceae bacterium]
MIEVCVKIPKDLNDIISETGAGLYVEALKEVAGRHPGHTENQIRYSTCMNPDKKGK